MESYLDINSKNAKYCARRLLRTESAYFSPLARKKMYEDEGAAHYEIVATLDSSTSDICKAMDKKSFLAKDYVIGATAPPFHPFCRTTDTFSQEDSWFTEGSRIARDEDGESYYVPADMAYQEWEELFVRGGNKEGLQLAEFNGTMEWKRTKEKLEGDKESALRQLKIELAIKGELDLHPSPLDVSAFSFDEFHINQERKRGITREEAIGFMDTASFTLCKWGGRFLNCFSPQGAVYLDLTNSTIRTAYRREQYSPTLATLQEAVNALLLRMEDEDDEEAILPSDEERN